MHSGDAVQRLICCYCRVLEHTVGTLIASQDWAVLNDDEYHWLFLDRF
jgi:hypothetical protein